MIIIVLSEAYLIVAPGQAPLAFRKQDRYLKLRVPLWETEDAMRISVRQAIPPQVRIAWCVQESQAHVHTAFVFYVSSWLRC